jgi:hypothetical protein
MAKTLDGILLRRGAEMVPAIEGSIYFGMRFKYKILSYITNGRHRRELIHSIVQDEGMIERHEQLKSYIRKYYKNMFCHPDEKLLIR